MKAELSARFRRGGVALGRHQPKPAPRGVCIIARMRLLRQRVANIGRSDADGVTADGGFWLRAVGGAVTFRMRIGRRDEQESR